MKKSKFTEAQIAFILRQAEEGTPVPEACRKAGISDATFYNWRKKYAGLMPSEMKRLRQLEEENARLKRSVADLSLAKEMLQDVIKPDAREKVEAWRREYNELRPHSAIGNKTPISLVNRPPACSPR
jgi:putative transposase